MCGVDGTKCSNDEYATMVVDLVDFSVLGILLIQPTKFMRIFFFIPTIPYYRFHCQCLEDKIVFYSLSEKLEPRALDS